MGGLRPTRLISTPSLVRFVVVSSAFLARPQAWSLQPTKTPTLSLSIPCASRTLAHSESGMCEIAVLIFFGSNVW